MDHFQLLPMAVVWAVASTQVAVESRQRLFVHFDTGMPCRWVQ